MRGRWIRSRRGGWRSRLVCGGVGLLCAGLVAGCSRDVTVPFYPVYDNSLLILRPAAETPAARATLDALADLFPQAQAVDFGDWSTALERAAHRVVLVADAGQLTEAQARSLTEALAADARLLFLGSAPFAGEEGGAAEDAVQPLLARLDATYAVRPAAVAGLQSKARFYLSQPRASAWQAGLEVAAAARAARWVPLFVALDAQEQVQGDVAGLMVMAADDAPAAGRYWGWVGLDVDRSTRSAWRTMVNECVFLLQQGRFLVEATTPQRVVEPGQQIEVTSLVRSPNRAMLEVRVLAELVDAEGVVVRQVRSPRFRVGGDTPAPASVTLSLGGAPAAASGAGGRFVVRCVLEEAGGRGLLFDRVAVPVRVLAARAEPDATQWLTVTGGRVVQGRIPVFLLGAAYRPSAVLARGDAWLTARHFPAERLGRDLARLRQAGANTVVLSYTDVRQAAQVRWVLEEARGLGLYVVLRWPTALARVDEPGWVEAMAAGVGLAQQPGVVAIDLAPARRAEAWVSAAWADWAEEQGVSGFDPLTLQDAPADDAGWALWRRFAADVQGRRLGRVAARLRAAGCRALLMATVEPAATAAQAPQEGGWALPFDFGTGAVHLDVASVRLPLAGDEAGLGAGARARGWAAYARGWLRGRPVIWWASEQAEPAGRLALRDGMGGVDAQAEAVQAFYDQALAGQAAGALVAAQPAWWGADGTERPVVEVVRAMAQRLRAYRASPSQWSGVTWPVWRGRDAMAWPAVSAADADEIRPVGAALSSRSAPAERLWDGRGPLTLVNAAWQPVSRSRLAVGETMTLTVLNTGRIAWDAPRGAEDGGVWVAIQQEGVPPQYVELPATPPGGRARLTWTATRPGQVTLRPIWLGAGVFGETLTLTVGEAAGG
jgi:hypothetical protein